MLRTYSVSHPDVPTHAKLELFSATLFTTSSILSFSVASNSTFFCSSAVPPSPLPLVTNSSYFYCPISAGPVAFSAAIPFGSHTHHLMTLNNRLRVVDTSSPAKELMCIDIATTPLDGDRMGNSVYGPAIIIFWVSVALCIAYWVITGTARLTAAWGRGGSGSNRRTWDRLKGAGYMLASAVSGERFAGTPALLRFCESTLFVCKSLFSEDARNNRYTLVAGYFLPYTILRSYGNGSSAVADVCL